MKLPCCFALFVLVSQPFSFAEEHTAEAEAERWFQVEVLIFKNPTLETDNPELWPSYAEIQHPPAFIRLTGISEILTDNSADDPDLAEANTPDTVMELSAPVSVEGLSAFQALSEAEQQMIGEHDMIARDRRYQVLFHEAWNQPVPSRDEVIPIRIDGGERFGRQSELQGYISLYVERYLHLSTDLHLIDYQKSTDPFSLVDEGANKETTRQMLAGFGGMSLLNADRMTNSQISRKSKQFFISVQDAQLKEKRRMRSKEIHYLDNPEFGILILITPIDIQ
ncbi:CsiV family protein [Reinekea sp.]|jgi:hypothetical protein|uniref:CsiV family protein n=1 Tax=Reinekea sp. TaxID=1970455 RepID=UPI002A7F9BBB|nr:CsiV family protein [Reinekea sp.]